MTAAEKLVELVLSGRFCDVKVLCHEKDGNITRVPMSRLILAAVGMDLKGNTLELMMPADAFKMVLIESFGLESRVLDVDLRAALAAWKTEVQKHASRSEVSGKDQPAPEPAPEPALEQASKVVLWSTLALTLGAFYAWAPAFRYKIFNNGFFMDDQMIARNSNVFGDLDWWRLFRTDYWGLDMFAGTWTHKSFRPLTVLTFRWNFLLHGFESSGFHVTNLILHFLCSALLAFFGLRCGLPASQSSMLGALFLIHPVHTESVLYIVGRADLICLALVIMSFLVHQATCPGKLFVACFGVVFSSMLLLAAGLCKETGFCFFGLMVGWDILLLTWGGCYSKRRLLVRMFLVLLVGIASCAARVWYTSGTTIERMDPFSNPVAAETEQTVRILSYALVHGIYGKLLVWPSFLCYDYSFDAVPLVRSLADCRLLLPISCYLAFMMLTTLSLRLLRMPARQRDDAVPIVGIAILILSFFPMSNLLFPVGTMVAERLLYIPSAGLLVAIVGISRHRYSHIALIAAGLVMTFLTAKRVVEWSSPEAITLADASKQPRSTRAQYNLATLHMSNKRYDEALTSFEAVMALDPTDRDCMPLYHAGQIQIYKGNHKAAEDLLARAVEGHFSPLLVNEEEVFHDYALALWFAEKPRDAILNFEKSLSINGTFAKGFNNLGCALGLGAVLGQLPQEALVQGVEQLQEALQLIPDNVLYWRNLVALLRFSGRPEVEAAWQQLLALEPMNAANPPEDCSWEFAFR